MTKAIARPADSTAAVTPEPTWEIAHLFPPRGQWTEADYLAIDTNRLIELSDGCLEVLPLPTTAHQMILAFLFRSLDAFVRERDLGLVLFAALPVRLWVGKIREPDILFMAAEHADRLGDQSWDGADLVMEVVSDDRKRDLEIKRLEYERARIPEYWIVDPKLDRIVVLALERDAYVEHGAFRPGQRAASRLLPDFEVDVAEALAGTS